MSGRRAHHVQNARSYLFVPGDDDVRTPKAFASAADAVILDLEDAVAPQNKGAARELARAALALPVTDSPAAVLRIGAVEGGPGLADLRGAFGPRLGAVRLPKVESAAAPLAVADLLDELEEQHGLERGVVELQCTIESARGVMRAEEIAASSDRVSALVFGHADFAADVQAVRTPEGSESFTARSLLVLASRSAGIGAPIDGAFTDLADPDGLERSVQQARRLGFGAKSAIHPKQLAAINKGFMPTAAEIEAAERQLAALKAALARGSAAATTSRGEFVDEAVAKRARAVLARTGIEP